MAHNIAPVRWNGEPPNPLTSGWHILYNSDQHEPFFWNADVQAWTVNKQTGHEAGCNAEPPVPPAEMVYSGFEYVGHDTRFAVREVVGGWMVVQIGFGFYAVPSDCTREQCFEAMRLGLAKDHGWWTVARDEARRLHKLTSREVVTAPLDGNSQGS